MRSNITSTLSALGLHDIAIMPEEYAGKNHDKPARPSKWVLKQMLEALVGYQEDINKREEVATFYVNSLPEHYIIPKKLAKKPAAVVRFPVLCTTPQQAERLFTGLRSAGHYSGKWYRPTLFPGATSPSVYNYDPESFPNAEDIASRILNLPTNITTEEAKEIVNVLQREAN
jgi:dTDP-4-amino-4,6-dideoxygalactose transaminase